MLRPTGLFALSLLLLACNGESPTEPGPMAADAAAEAAARRRGAVTHARELPPQCSKPAPLRISSCPAPGYLVSFREGTDVEAQTEELARRYGFQPRHVWPPIGFSAVMSVETMTALRCEPSIRSIEENGYLGGQLPPCSQ